MIAGYETGRRDWRRCVVEKAQTKHREEDTGLWRCCSCGFAKGEILDNNGEKAG